MIPTYALATRSADKAREIRQILGGSGAVSIATLAELGVPPAPDEDHIEAFDTFRANALAKARHFARSTRLPTIADDSGLVVPSLDGEPGVRSKRFAARPGLHGLELDRANNDLLLQRLHGVPPDARAAYYVCAAAVADPDSPGPGSVFLGTCAGLIAAEPHGSAGFGYDPIFFVPALGRTFGQVPATLKNRVSHRARAFRALAALLLASQSRA